jgi:hypothetical protein
MRTVIAKKIAGDFGYILNPTTSTIAKRSITASAAGKVANFATRKTVSTVEIASVLNATSDIRTPGVTVQSRIVKTDT